MYRMHCCLLAIALAAGCAKSEDVAQNSPAPAPSGNGAADASPAAAPAADPASETSTDLTLGKPQLNRGNGLGEKPSPAETAKPIAKEEPPSTPGEEPAKPKTSQEWLEVAQKHLRSGNVEAGVSALTEAVKLDPKNRNLVLGLANLLQQHGGQLGQSGESKKAYAKFLESGRLMRGLLEEVKQFNPNEQKLYANVIYNEACALSMTGDPAKALVSLRESLEAGFSDLALAEKDEDLVEVRKLEGYKPLMEELKVKAAEAASVALEAAREEAKKLIAAQESFPFNFELTDVDDKPVKLADSKGKVTIVDFWGTWCPPCRMEVPHFVELQKKYKDDLQIVGLNYENAKGDAAKDLIKKFIADNSMNYPCAIGDEATQDQVPELNAFPTTLFIDREGKVRLKAVGYHPLAKLEAIVTELLAEKAPAEKKE